MNLSPELRALTLLARKQRHGEATPQQDAASYTELRTRRQRRRQRFRLGSGLASLSLCAAFALGFWLYRGADTLHYREQPLASVAGSGRELMFSDGSRLTVEPDAQLEVDVLTRNGAQLTLKRGRSKLAIAPRKGANWSVQAGPYRVRVTGTVFDVGWSERDGRLEVAMQHGAVVVTGPLAGAGITLKAGQRLRATPRLRQLAVERVDAVAAVAPPAAAAPKPHEVHEAEPPEERAEPQLDATELKTSSQGRTRAWSSQVSNGKFQEVLRQAKARGLARSLRECTASDLAALADAGRLANRNDVARSALLALRKRFPRSEQAQNAAFLLARLTTNGKALEWYARYLRESPSGAYVSQALGESMLIHQQRSDPLRARKAASDYLARNPDGRYAAAARAILSPLAQPGAPISP